MHVSELNSVHSADACRSIRNKKQLFLISWVGVCSNAPKIASGYIAQWLERLTADQQVPGSNPGVPFSPWAQLQSSTSIPLLRQQGQEEGNQRPQGLCGRNMARALFVTMPLGKGSINLFSAFVAPPCLTRAVIAQLAARRSHNPKVVSSILTHRISPC